MDSPLKLLQQVRRRVQTVTYGSALYRHLLDQGPAPERLRIKIIDPWPGDAARGQAIIAQPPALFVQETMTRERSAQEKLTHDCLRDLRAVGSDHAKRKAATLIHDWTQEQETWTEDHWGPVVLSTRLANWIGFFDFYAPMLPDAFRPILLQSMTRQLRHLVNTAPANLIGCDGLAVIRGLIYGGLGLIDSERSVGLALDRLMRQLTTEILPDGGLISRNPQELAQALRCLLDIRMALIVGQLEIPPDLTLAIARMVPALRMLRHGDGALAVFNGGREFDPVLLDSLLSLAEVRGRALKQLAQTGYERLAAGRSLVIVDSGGPPPKPFDISAHAGLMAFEFSVGRERLLVNCGPGPVPDSEWRRAMAATAAHNTIIYDNTNACEIMADGGIGQRPREVVSQRYEQEGLQAIELTHDGYAQRHKIRMARRLSLSADGETLSGCDTITGPAGSDFTIRWHIHPNIDVSLAQGGRSALLRTPSGQGWRLRVHGGWGEDMALETSVYCGGGPPQRTFQLRVSGRVRESVSVVEWSFVRETMKKGATK